MKKIIALVLAVLMLNLSGFGGISEAFAADVSDSKEKQTESNITLKEKSQKSADYLVNEFGATSVQYALIDNGEFVLSGSSGVYDKTENKPIEKDNMYGIGSVSKMFATVSVMKLVDMGKIDIDKPLTTYITEFKMADERYKEITPRMLMNHSSGIYGTTNESAFTFDKYNPANHDMLLSNLKEQRLKNAPGEISTYCNDGFTLLEILVERVSGIGFTEFISKYLSQPLGVENTKTPLDNFDRNKLAKVYMPMFETAFPIDAVSVIGAGGIYSTAEDLCRFAEVFIGEKPEVLSKKSALAMQNEEYKNGMWVDDNGENNLGFGLGWDNVHSYPFNNYDIKALVKGGDTMLYHSSLVVIPEYNIAMAVNTSGGSSSINCVYASSILEEYLLEKGIIDKINPKKSFESALKTDMPEEIKRHSGTYANSSDEFTLEIKDGEVELPQILSILPAQKYVYTGDHTFKNIDGSASLKFVQEKDGNMYVQVKTYINLPGLGQIAFADYFGQKIMPNVVAEEVLAVWKNRAAKKYYLVSEKSNSQFYFNGQSLQTEIGSDFKSGFGGPGAKIIDENLAVNVLKVFRDVTDIQFYTQDGIEYLKATGLAFMVGDNINDIHSGESSISTIQANGFAKYYNIGENTQGKEMTVDIPDNAAYAVYDENGVCINFTTITKNNKTVLPSKGKIVFIGNAGDVFKITLRGVK